MQEPFALGMGEPNGPYRARWEAVQREIASDRAALRSCRIDSASCSEGARHFLGIVDAGRTREGRSRMGEINRAVNLAIRYVSDAIQHGRDDVWSSPLATFSSGMGDCEDFAIAKLVALAETGMPESDLRLVLVRRPRTGELHAVAAARLDGEWLILDNARLTLVPDHDASDYRGVVAFDQSGVASQMVARGTLPVQDESAAPAT